MRIFPTPPEGETKKRGNYSPSEGGHGVVEGENAAAGGSCGGDGSAHLRKVRRKCVEMTHLREVGMVWGVGKCSYRRLSGRWCLCAPSEGETKMRGNDSPSEGGHGVGCWKMRLQAALGEVVLQRTFGRWDENAGKRLTFGRWVEGKVYGADESVRPEVSENGQVSDIGHF